MYLGARAIECAGVGLDRARRELAAEVVLVLEREVLVGVEVGALDEDQLVVVGDVLRASGRGVVPDGAGAEGAVVALVPAVADALLREVLVPELVVERRVRCVHEVDLFVGEAAPVTAAVVGAGGAAAGLALEAGEAVADALGVVAGAAGGALRVLAHAGDLRVHVSERLLDVEGVAVPHAVAAGHRQYPGSSVPIVQERVQAGR